MDPLAAKQPTGQAPLSGLGRAFLVLDYVARCAPEPQSLTVITREVGLPKTVVHRIVKELTAHGYFDFDEAKRDYRLGPEALTLGMAALRARNVPSVALPYLERLVSETRETATLSVRRHCERTYIRQVLSPQEVRMSVTLGVPYPLHAGSSSKAILAALPDPEGETCLESGLAPFTANTITSKAQLAADLAAIRKRGWAESLGERQAEAGSVAAPLHTIDGAVFGAISLCGPITRFTKERVAELGALISKTAREISSALGYDGPAFPSSSGEL